MVSGNIVGFWSRQTTAFFIASVVSALEKSSHSDWGCEGTLSSNQKLIGQFWAKLKVWWRAY